MTASDRTVVGLILPAPVADVRIVQIQAYPMPGAGQHGFREVRVFAPAATP